MNEIKEGLNGNHSCQSNYFVLIYFLMFRNQITTFQQREEDNHMKLALNSRLQMRAIIKLPKKEKN